MYRVAVQTISDALRVVVVAVDPLGNFRLKA